ncbi:MAG: alpha/beta hydrolase [Burkholderiaceae bacterium]|nr:MAG: alpha/beta hydrolase [Burkholderiaceae bacterium]
MPSTLDLPQFFASELDYPLAYTQTGAGEIQLLIHGSLCDYRYWRWQLAALGQQYHVVAPSLRGCWPNAFQVENARFSIAQHTEDIINFVSRHMRGHRVHVLGHSRGAHVALEMALAAPDLVTSLILADPGFRIDSQSDAHSFLQTTVSQLQEGNTEAALSEFVDTVNGEGTWRHMVDWFKTMVRDNATTLLSQSLETDLVFDPARARQLKCPVLLLGGANSPPRYGRVISALAENIAQAQRDTIALAAHGMNLANPRAFNERVLQFLSTTTATTS